MTNKLETAIFGAGCFWGVEETFRTLSGVKATTVGYAGGKRENPTYEQVCTGVTGHAEVLKIEFDPEEISYEKLLEIFWKSHNPTSVNRQGPDVGEQYRSVIFYATEEQKAVAEKSKENLANSGRFSKPIATEILPAPTFFPAEEYHQKYLMKRNLDSCHL